MRHLDRMRPAQERARLILDIERGDLRVEAPAVSTETDRARLELAARTLARNLLDQPTREYLLALERAQASSGLEELGLAGDIDDVDPPDEPETIGRLHHAVTIARLVQTTPTSN